jgi:phenylacetate-CoA oxygenase PaaI subunit
MTEVELARLLLTAPTPEIPQQHVAMVLGLADDEFITGHRHSEWLGLSPFLEEDLTMASIAQDEFGHARALYGLLWPTWVDRDANVVRRPPADWRSCSLVEQPISSWEDSFIRHLIYDVVEPYRWSHLAEVWPRDDVAGLVGRVAAEERFHRRHAVDLFNRISRGGLESASRLQSAIEAQWPMIGVLLSDVTPPIRDAAIGDLSEVIVAAELDLPNVAFDRDYSTDRTVRSAGFDEVHVALLDVVSFDPEAHW